MRCELEPHWRPIDQAVAEMAGERVMLVWCFVQGWIFDGLKRSKGWREESVVG